MNVQMVPRKRALGRVFVPSVTLAHDGGGKAMKDLIDDVFISAFAGAAPEVLEDQARFDLSMLATHGDRLAFTTDSFVVDPLFFLAATSASSPSAARSTTWRSAAPSRSTCPARW
jgi:hydrogenase expression/formation protein HypE